VTKTCTRLSTVIILFLSARRRRPSSSVRPFICFPFSFKYNWLTRTTRISLLVIIAPSTDFPTTRVCRLLNIFRRDFSNRFLPTQFSPIVRDAAHARFTGANIPKTVRRIVRTYSIGSLRTLNSILRILAG